MTATSENLRLVVERHFAAAPEEVFDAWLDPASVGRWLFATPGGVVERVELDPRVGGRFRIDERRGDELAEHVGEYVDIDRPRRLAFTFFAGSEDESSLVTVTFAPDGDGTKLVLVHEMDAKWADHEARVRDGWTMILEGLAELLG